MKKHWSLEYIYNRLKNYFFEKKNNHLPWINKNAIKVFKNLLQKTDKGVEFGSGRSTVWFSRQVGYLTSIEDNQKWFDKVKIDLHQKSINNVAYLFKKSNDESPADCDYCKVINSFDNDSLDFVIIDGKYRGIFALNSINKLKKGGFIYLDDAHRYFPLKTASPHSLGENPDTMTKNWKLFKNEVINWRKIVTTDGVSDGMFFIKR
jgi:hypothetical protein